MLSAIVPLRVGVEEGLKYLPFLVGACLVLRLCHFPDVGIEGSFALGAAAVAFAQSQSLPMWTALVLAVTFGVLAGSLTASLFAYCCLNSIVCGVITSSVAFSVAFWLLGSRAASPISVFLNEYEAGAIGLCSVLLIVLLFSTRFALPFRFAGENPAFLSNLGVRGRNHLIVLVALGNSLVSVSGAIVVGIEGSANLRLGDSKLFLAIIALVLGEGAFSALFSTLSLFRLSWRTGGLEAPGKLRSFIGSYFSGSGAAYVLVSAAVGSCVYWMVYNACTRVFGAKELTQAVLGILTAAFLIFTESASFRSHRLTPWRFFGKAHDLGI